MKRKFEKNTTIIEGDLALVLVENKPAFFARVERIDADRKVGWWQVKLLILNLPLKVVTWVLDDEQIRGADFTMGGVPVRLEKIIAPPDEREETDLHPRVGPTTRRSREPGKSARILTFKPRGDIPDEPA
jgi:hypothetical protein